ncbi:glycosyltransferase family 1 protein [Marinobacter sp. Arc7-DN-1]|nr:glycosyltransferase family 1 protein [Marinobacter sp. Arc7-DN-1]
MLSNITIRHSDLMIVTNPFLKEFVDCMGGNGVVLPDKIPAFQAPLKKEKLQGEFNVFFICTFSDDEPFQEVLEAAKLMPSDWVIYVSGNYKKANIQPDRVPQNVVLLGFVEEDDYLLYLSSVDAVMVLTTLDYTLNCGAYEAVALNKPMVLSYKKTIINYFNKGAVYVEPVAQSIIEGIGSLFENFETFENEVKELKCELELSWNKQFSNIDSKISSFTDDSAGQLK